MRITHIASAIAIIFFATFVATPVNAQNTATCEPSDAFMENFNKVNERRALKKVDLDWNKERFHDKYDIRRSRKVGFSITSDQHHGFINFNVANPNRLGLPYIFASTENPETVRIIFSLIGKFNWSGMQFKFDDGVVRFNLNPISQRVSTYSTSGNMAITTYTWVGTASREIPWDLVRKIANQDPTKPFPVYPTGGNAQFSNRTPTKCPLYIHPLEFAAFVKKWDEAQEELREEIAEWEEKYGSNEQN